MSFNSIRPMNFKGTIIVKTEYALHGEPVSKLKTECIKEIEGLCNSDKTAIIRYNENEEEARTYDKKFRPNNKYSSCPNDTILVVHPGMDAVVKAYNEVKDSDKTIDLTK